MSDWTPGEGWREVQYGADLEGHEHISWDSTGLAGGTSRMWIREAPVPPLPTAPYTVIRVTWSENRGHSDWILSGSSHKWVNWISGTDIDPHELAGNVTGFEVLAEPRAVTAKAVLDLIHQDDELSGLTYQKLQAVFGVDL